MVISILQFLRAELTQLKEGIRGAVLSIFGGVRREELEELGAQNRSLQMEAQARQTMKRRSPADWRFRVLRWELGEQTIFPLEFPKGKVVPNLRVWIHLDDQSEGAPYWDITSKRVIAMLLPILPDVAGKGVFLHVRKDGDGPSSVFSLSVEQP